MIIPMTIHDMSWAAGLFEGEGSFVVARHGGNPYPRAQLRMTDEDVVRLFHSVLGVGSVTGPYRSTNGRKPVWEWRAGGDDAKAVAGVFWPYLGARRRDQANAVLQHERAIPTRRGTARCGTKAGADVHYRAGEKPCDPCRLAHNEYERARYSRQA